MEVLGMSQFLAVLPVLHNPAPRQKQPQLQHRPGNYLNHMYVKWVVGLISLHNLFVSSFPQQGNNFFDTWDFFTGSDPTHGAFQPNIIASFFSRWFAGVVDYIDEQTAVRTMIFVSKRIKSEFDP
jgi:hypothetical protein